MGKVIVQVIVGKIGDSTHNWFKKKRVLTHIRMICIFCKQIPHTGELRTTSPGDDWCSIANTARKSGWLFESGRRKSRRKTCPDSQQVQGLVPDPGRELQPPNRGDVLWKVRLLIQKWTVSSVEGRPVQGKKWPILVK